MKRSMSGRNFYICHGFSWSSMLERRRGLMTSRLVCSANANTQTTSCIAIKRKRNGYETSKSVRKGPFSTELLHTWLGMIHKWMVITKGNKT